MCVFMPGTSTARRRCDTRREEIFRPPRVTAQAYLRGVDQVRAVVAWLGSDAGKRAVRRAAERQGVVYLADDLVGDVLYRTQVADARGDRIENVAAWSTRLLHDAAVDLLRGERRRFLPLPALPDEHDDAAEPPDAAPGIEDALVHVDVVEQLRRAIVRMLVPCPWVGAAALARLAYALDGAGVAVDCPRPAGGAGEQEAADWAGLWYAGRDECFPGAGEMDGNTIRQRRARAASKVRALLAEALRVEEAATRG
jgi:DNA-directed RNA polymerase specialized sigma24 family protein